MKDVIGEEGKKPLLGRVQRVMVSYGAAELIV